jgi:hypothetical protein
LRSWKASSACSPNPERTLDERRRLIKAYFVGFWQNQREYAERNDIQLHRADSEVKFEPGDAERNNYLSIFIERGREPTLYLAENRHAARKENPGSYRMARRRYGMCSASR